MNNKTIPPDFPQGYKSINGKFYKFDEHTGEILEIRNLFGYDITAYVNPKAVWP